MLATGISSLPTKDWQRVIGTIVSAIVEMYPNRCESTASSDDLKQEAWVSLYRAQDRFDPTRGTKFSTYAYATLFRDLRRFVQRQPTPMNVETLPETSGVCPQAKSVEDAEIIATAMAGLSDDERDLVERHVVHGVRLRDLGDPWQTARNKYYRACHKMRQAVENH